MKGKSKIVLGLTAGVLAASLAVGGTFMLFSAQTEAANNIVTMGTGISAQLLEQSDMTEDYVSGGINYVDATAPGQILIKEAIIQRNDGNPDSASDAYIAVKLTVGLAKRVVVEPAGSILQPVSVADAAIAAKNNLSSELKDSCTDTVIQNMLNQVIPLINTATNPAEASAAVDGPIVNTDDWTYNYTPATDPTTAWLFYTNKDTKALKALTPGTSADPGKTNYMFTNIQIPDYNGLQAEIYAALSKADIKLNMQLTGYLVQSENNPYKNLGAGNETFSKYQKAFPTTSININNGSIFGSLLLP